MHDLYGPNEPGECPGESRVEKKQPVGHGFTDEGCLPRRQASLQKRTWSQSRAHFFRQAKGRPQAAQNFCGRCCFFTPFIAG
jgi:hypothetical protein